MAGSNSASTRVSASFGGLIRLAAVVGFSIAASAVGAQEPRLSAQSTQGPLRSTVNRVNVGVTVTDSRGQFISGLQRQDFRVFDNGVEQPIADFLPVAEPAQFLLLIESGPAVFLFAKNHMLAADLLLSAMAPGDRVAVAQYSRTPELILDLTGDQSAARMALRSIDFHSGYGELNLFSAISTAVDRLATINGKKSIVLLSTGVDTSPDVDWDRLQKKLQISDVRIIAVSLSGDLRKPAKKRKLSEKEKTDRAELNNGFREADHALRQISQATGGRVYLARNSREITAAYAEIAELLRHEYSLAFAPQALDGQVHTLRVEVHREGARVDHRPAYLAAVP